MIDEADFPAAEGRVPAALLRLVRPSGLLSGSPTFLQIPSKRLMGFTVPDPSRTQKQSSIGL